MLADFCCKVKIKSKVLVCIEESVQQENAKTQVMHFVYIALSDSHYDIYQKVFINESKFKYRESLQIPLMIFSIIK